MAIFNPIAGITPDKSADFGFFGLLNNVNNYSEALSAPIAAGGGVTITAAQATVGITNFTSASGGFNVTLPSTVALIASLGSTVAFDGSYAEPISMMNNGTGQTGTLVAGDSSTTLTGTMTFANNTRRLLLLTVTSPTTITIQNVGTVSL